MNINLDNGNYNTIIKIQLIIVNSSKLKLCTHNMNAQC